MEPINLIMLVLVMVLLDLAATTAAPRQTPQNIEPLHPSAASLSHCPTTCGDFNISDAVDYSGVVYTAADLYPFGIGPGCFRPGFEVICSTATSTLFLGDGTTEAVFFDSTDGISYVGVKSKIHIMQQSDNSYNGQLVPGPQFTIYAYALDNSLKSRFVVIGCGVDAYLLDENQKEIANCSTFCESEKETRNHIGNCSGIGCCNIPIENHLNPISFKINRDPEKSKLALQNVKAFVQVYSSRVLIPFINHTFTYEDLESSDNVQGMTFSHVILAWVIDDQQTCRKAQEDNTTYACVSEHSECKSNGLGATGYSCECSQNYDGNPFILDGCQDYNEYNRSWPGPDCPRYCGDVRVPFPFGFTEGCYGRESFRLVCKDNSQLLIPLVDESGYFYKEDAKSYQVTNVVVNEGYLEVEMPLNKSFSVSVENNAYTSTLQRANFSWVINNITCQEAMQNRSTYACVSANSACHEINGFAWGADSEWGALGYRCKCNSGYEGNPYVIHGCNGTLFNLSPILL